MSVSKVLLNIIGKRATEKLVGGSFERTGFALKKEIDEVFGRSLALRELDSGSDNSTEIELVNLTTPHYDVERFGVSFVASPRHADVLIVTGAITRNMQIAAIKTYEAMPHPKFVVAVGDDACNGGVYRGSYAVLGGADTLLPVDLKIPGNPPSPERILSGLLELMHVIRSSKGKRASNAPSRKIAVRR